MTVVATWKDGPRYAPIERPRAFAEPVDATSLAVGDPAPDLPSASTVPPESFHEPSDAVPLASVTPTQRDQRDPDQPFTVAAMALTATGDLGEESVTVRHSPHSPLEPFQVASTSLTLSTTWAPPPPDALPVTAVRSVRVADCFTAAYPPLLVLLVVMGVVGLAEPLLSMLATIGAFFWMIPRVRFRVKTLRATTIGYLGFLALLFVIGRILDTTTYNVDLGINTWTMVGSWAVAVVDVALQWWALRHGDKPNPAS
jgi:hypothetical protein